MEHLNYMHGGCVALAKELNKCRAGFIEFVRTEYETIHCVFYDRETDQWIDGLGVHGTDEQLIKDLEDYFGDELFLEGSAIEGDLEFMEDEELIKATQEVAQEIISNL